MGGKLGNPSGHGPPACQERIKINDSDDDMRTGTFSKDNSSPTIIDAGVHSQISISNMFTDKYVLEILSFTNKFPKSAQHISRTFGIPIAVCYRRIHLLEMLGFLKCTDSIPNGKGKRVKFYRSQITSMYLYLKDGKLQVKVKFSSGATNDFGGKWSWIDSMSDVSNDWK
jgi:hypothetical protein